MGAALANNQFILADIDGFLFAKVFKIQCPQNGDRIFPIIFFIKTGNQNSALDGIPDMPFIDPNFYKDNFNVEGKKVILTFGLLSPNKGIENVLKALPSVIQKHPDVIYIILGATHPHILKAQGEEYRISLQQIVRKLNIGDHVILTKSSVYPGKPVGGAIWASGGICGRGRPEKLPAVQNLH